MGLRRSTAARSQSRPTSATYDPAGHLIEIDVAGSTEEDVTFSIDALGRQGGRTIDGATTLYAYLGTSAQVSSTATDASPITLASYSAIDAIGNRISTGLSGAFAYLAVDLHGNVAGAISGGSDPEYLAGFRYDASGQSVDSYTATGSDVAVPFGYQGRIRQNAPGATDLYDFGARSYDPSLASFISFDTVTGSAQNPLSLNRYLYALSNPATMVDPDGHEACYGSYCPGAQDNWDVYHAMAEQHQRSLAARQEAIKQGCPAGYCGTDDQKKAWFDSTASELAVYKAMPRLGHVRGMQAAEAQNQGGCNWAPWEGNSCVGQAANTVNQGWQSTGGAAVNWGVEHPTVVLAVAGVVAACGIPGVNAVACAPALWGAAAGLSAYTAGNAWNNWQQGKGLSMEGWNLDDAATMAVTGEAMFVTGGALNAAYASATVPMGLTLAESLIVRAGLTPLVGGTEALVGFGVSHVLGNPSPAQDVCNVASSMAPGNLAAYAATVACGFAR